MIFTNFDYMLIEIGVIFAEWVFSARAATQPMLAFDD